MTHRSVLLGSALFPLAATACALGSRSPGAPSTTSSAAPAAAAPAAVASVSTASPLRAATPAGSALSNAPGQPADPPFISTPEPRLRPAAHPRGSALGIPKDLRDSGLDGVWVWHDERGNEWHLRTSTHGPAHRFNGRVWLGEGSFAGVRPSRTEWSDRLRATGKAIEFDFRMQNGGDGFEFRVGGARCVHFALFIDGRSDTDSIHIGASGAHPKEHAFTLCP